VIQAFNHAEKIDLGLERFFIQFNLELKNDVGCGKIKFGVIEVSIIIFRYLK
jgi:hypothetical protein